MLRPTATAMVPAAAPAAQPPSRHWRPRGFRGGGAPGHVRAWPGAHRHRSAASLARECRGGAGQAGWRCRAAGGARAGSGYFGRMARPGRSEDTSVPIWLKLSAVDSAKMDQVLARPEFEGWTKGEWCLEIIQTALRYYTKPRPAGEPGRKRAPARPAAAPAPPPAESVPPTAEAMPPLAEPEPLPAEAAPPPSEAEPPRAEAAPPPQVRPAPPRGRPARTTAKRPPPPPAGRTSPSREPVPAAPERPQPRRPSKPERPQPRRSSEPEQPQSRRPLQSQQPEPPQREPRQPVRPDSAQLDSGELDSRPEAECSHPAEARDYQSGTCAACGAILWD